MKKKLSRAKKSPRKSSRGTKVSKKKRVAKKKAQKSPDCGPANGERLVGVPEIAQQIGCDPRTIQRFLGRDGRFGQVVDTRWILREREVEPLRRAIEAYWRETNRWKSKIKG